MKNSFLIILLSYICGCASQPDSVDSFYQTDPNEKIINGKVVLKKEVNKDIVKKRMKEHEENKNYEATLSTIMTAGTGLFIMPYNFDDAVPGNPTEYAVKLNSGNTLTIFSHFTGFSVGDCVKVFISENWKKYPPRMATGGEC